MQPLMEPTPELTQAEIDELIAKRKPLAATAVREMLAAKAKDRGRVEELTESYIELTYSTQDRLLNCNEHGKPCLFALTYRLEHRITITKQKDENGVWYQTGFKCEYLGLSFMDKSHK